MRVRAAAVAIGLMAALTVLPPTLGVAGAARAPTPDVLPGPRHGQAAIRELGSALSQVAAANHKSPAELTRLLRTDATMWLDEDGRLFVRDSFAPPPAASGAREDAPFPNAQTFQLHSKPGADRVIYLDFDGQVVAGTAWGVSSDPQPAFDMDGDPTNWSQAEVDVIQSVFQRVSEDYAPFDVDVTTEEPGLDALNRDSAADQTFGTRVLITPSLSAHQSLCGGTCGGVAFVGIFNDVDNTYYEPAWVFANTMQNNPKYIAEAASHEAGHNLGLSHDGTASLAYYAGQYDWAPIMGVGYYEPISQWSKGEYPDANNTQDDFAVIQSFGLPLRADDHASTIADATSLGTKTTAGGVITSRDDADMFSFTRTCSGSTTITVAPSANSPNLDAGLRILDSAGAVVGKDDPPSSFSTYDVAKGLSATVTADLAAGTYYIEVKGVGMLGPATGYSDYGSVGPYSLALTACATTSVLTVTKAGSGTGTVTSTPAGIACGATCSAGFATGSSVVLTAAPQPTSTFAGWSGACAGTSTCTVSMSGDQSVTATFGAGTAACTISGTAGDDVLRGTRQDDVICGKGGNDTLLGLGGDDTLIGGPGRDEVDFGSATGPVTVRLASGTATGQGNDKLRGIESIDGSRFADKLVGDELANRLAGKGGNDTIIGAAGNDKVYGGRGDDTLSLGDGADTGSGGAGTDTVAFGAAVHVNLAAGTATGQGADTLATIENVDGSRAADTLRGSAGRNVLSGGLGNDTILGAGGNDILNGQRGNDSMNGGAGTDRCGGGAGTDTGAACETRVSIP
jgi:RTX calcium-binding nonapeptide repeat (4 copies)/Divergent InlB B-repeat domain